MQNFRRLIVGLFRAAESSTGGKISAPTRVDNQVAQPAAGNRTREPRISTIQALLLVGLMPVCGNLRAAGVVVWKEQAFHSDEGATAAVFTNTRWVDPVRFFTIQGKEARFDPTKIFNFVEVPSAFPDEVTTPQQISDVRTQLKTIEDFGKKYRKAQPLLSSTCESLKAFIAKLDTGSIRFQGAWMDRATYERRQKELAAKYEQLEKELNAKNEKRKKDAEARLQAQREREEKEEKEMAEAARQRAEDAARRVFMSKPDAESVARYREATQKRCENLGWTKEKAAYMANLLTKSAIIYQEAMAREGTVLTLSKAGEIDAASCERRYRKPMKWAT